MNEFNPAVEKQNFQTTAQWLGYLGLIPFIVCTLLLLSESFQPIAADALKFYAATILAFIGAIHWGRSLATQQSSALIFSVTPSLYAWLCLLLPGNWALLALVTGFLGVNIYDQSMYRDQLPWFARMRWQLKTIASAALLSGFMILSLNASTST